MKTLSARSNIISSLLLIVLLITACGEEPEHITDVNFDEVEFAHFVEREFPFITTSMMMRHEDEWFIENNVAARCVALILGEESYACFDTDMLRWAAAWTGDFVPMEGVAHKSYPDYLGRNDKMVELPAVPDLVTGQYPGWNADEPVFEDPRPPAPHPDEPSWGPMPQEMGRWNGVYVTDDGPVLFYTVDNTDIYEFPGSIESGGGTVFTRTFRINSPASALSLTAGELSDATDFESTLDRVEFTRNNGDEKTIFALSSDSENAELNVTDGRYAVVRVLESEDPVEFTLMIWNGSEELSEEINQAMSEASFHIPDHREGGTSLWPDDVYTRGKIAPDTSAYVVDELTLPIPNPWDRNVRVVDLAFFDDGRAAVVTFEGDVWIVDGIDGNLNSMKWNRFASGLYETQSIEIVEGEIYTYGKEGIVRLHDLNGNGAADYYENFSNLMAQSIETREWASDFVAKPDGGFYAAKGAALDMGPHALTEAVERGIRAGSQHSGVILEISQDGRSAEVIASGFRGPYLGIHPETGLLTASDQEGHHVPSTPILTVHEGDFYGVNATAHREQIPEITPPLLWIPHNVDRSSISQTWITSDQMGPLNGDLIHMSYGRPGLFRVLIDSTESGAQGGVSVIAGHYPVPTMKGTIHPTDGQLYVGGFTLWGTNSDGMTGLLRLRYTGQPSYMPNAFKVRQQSVVLRFDSELNAESVSDISNYRVERWNYRRTEEYGSGHFKLDGSPGQELLPVFSAHLSDDGKGIFLAIPNIEEAQQMEISYSLTASDGQSMNDKFWFTVNHVDSMDLLAEGFSEIEVDDLFTDASAWEALDENGEPVTVERGKELFQRSGCMGCHTVDGSEGTGVGPTMKGLIGKERTFRDGSTTVADEEYLRHKIVNPAERIVEGYDEGMPSFLGILSDEEIDSIVLYIKSLDE
ncbi:hypothetical protein BH23BAC3_BH23BAC3_33210 [soil metagenome]